LVRNCCLFNRWNCQTSIKSWNGIIIVIFWIGKWIFISIFIDVLDYFITSMKVAFNNAKNQTYWQRILFWMINSLKALHKKSRKYLTIDSFFVSEWIHWIAIKSWNGVLPFRINVQTFRMYRWIFIHSDIFHPFMWMKIASSLQRSWLSTLPKLTRKRQNREALFFLMKNQIWLPGSFLNGIKNNKNK